MKVVIINGSPKGKHSITLQYIRFLQKHFPAHEYSVVHVAQKIKALDKNEALFSKIMNEIQSSDLVLWSFGVWVLAVSAQLMRFIELIQERKAGDVFQGKYTAALSTSIHYFDHTAHIYLRSVCEDLEMRFVDNLSFDIMDLKQPVGQRQILAFADYVFNTVEKKAPTSRYSQPLLFHSFDYRPQPATSSVETRGKKVLILTDRFQQTTNLGRMISRFRSVFSGPVALIDLNDIDIKGACLGCMKCGYDYQCRYKDEFTEFYNSRVRTFDIIVMAGELKGRYLSSLWKTFFDRAFFWNHTPSLEGKQIAFLITGPLRQNENLMQLLEASVTARQNANFVDVVTDETESSTQIDARLDQLAERLVNLAERSTIKPQNFLAVGGHKIFRDNIWGRLRGLWQADHRFYKKNGYYDFPQNNLVLRVMGPLLMVLTSIPRFRKAYYDNVKKMPAKRFSRLVDKVCAAEKQEMG